MVGGLELPAYLDGRNLFSGDDALRRLSALQKMEADARRKKTGAAEGKYLYLRQNGNTLCSRAVFSEDRGARGDGRGIW